MSKKRIVAAVMGDGRIGLIKQDVPAVRPGTVLVRVHASLVSPGTELGGWHQLKAEAASPKKDFKPAPFGYANAGVVAQVGEGVGDLAKGDRVACMGGGAAQHTDLAVVPHNLCVKLPDNVTFEQGAYAHLAATGLQALRRAEPQFGESFAVVGLGLVGQLTAMLLQLDGGYVIGWETLGPRQKIARKWGIDALVNPAGEDAVAASLAFTGNFGLDGAVIAFGGDGTKAYESLFQSLRKTSDGHRTGRIVVVGGAKLTIPWGTGNHDIRISARTGAGYHDDAWEVGADYPAAHMRWTTKTHLKLVVRLMSEGRLKVNTLTTHTMPLKDVEAGVANALNDPDRILGMVFTM